MECNFPLSNPNSFGYHAGCAEIAHARSNKAADEKCPFVVIDEEGGEMERFETEGQANDYLYCIQHSKIEHRQ